MRITGLGVGGFGLLADLDVDGIGKRTTVVCGPNEAGKSTLHTFIVRTLFGHPRINDARGRHRHEPLRGGRHGGVVRAIDDDGGTWEIHRYTTGTPVLRVVGPDGTESTSDDVLAGLLGRGTDVERYEQVYAIDLDALAGLGSLAGDALDELLLDAATVGSGRSMRSSIAALAERRDALWTPRSRKLPLNEAIAARRAAERRLRDARDAAGTYRTVQAELEGLDRDLDQVRTEQTSVREQVRRLERLQGAWGPWGELRDAQQRIAEAGDVVVPEELEADVSTLQAERQSAAKRAEGLYASSHDYTRAADAVPLDNALAEVAGRVADHAADLGLQEDRRRRLEVAAGHARATADIADQAVAALPEAWDAGRVTALPSDPTNLPTIQRTSGDLRTSQQELRATERDVEEARGNHDEARNRANEFANALGDKPSADVRTRRAAVGALRGALPDLERLEDQPAAATGPRWPTLVAAAAALALVGIGASALAGGSTFLGLGALAAAIVVGIAAGGMVRAARPTTPPGPTGARSTADLKGQIADTARVLDLSPPITRTDVELADQATTEVEDRVRAWQQRRDAARITGEAAETAAALLARAEQRRDGATRALEAAEAAWIDARDRVGLGVDAQPASAAVLLGAITEARRALIDADRAATSHSDLDRDVTAFDAKTVELRTAARRGPAGALDAALRWLAEDCQADAVARTERDRLISRAEEDRKAAETEARQVEIHDAELTAAYASVATNDAETFAAVVATAADRRVAEHDRDRADQQLRRLLGDDDEAAKLRAELATGRVAAWADDLAELQRIAADLEEERDRLVGERTSTGERLEELGEDDAVAIAALAVETHTARCAELAEQWATANLAAGLLQTTLERFEDAHQPSVLHEAGALLAQATLGRWTDVRRIDDELYVVADRDPVPASALSRGATEQLYLCLRLALAEELNRNGARLPLLIDDLMANADPGRADGLARILADIATRQQVVVFTCNPATVDRVVAADPTAGVLSLEQGGTRASWTRTPAS